MAQEKEQFADNSATEQSKQGGEQANEAATQKTSQENSQANGQANTGAEAYEAAGENTGDNAPESKDDFREKYVRAVAETENLRKRMNRDVEDTRQYAVTGFAREMLDVADNLERALAAIDKDKVDADPQLKNLVEGVEMVHGQLQRTFGKFKIEKTTPEPGEKFNPELHQAMFEVPTADQPPGTVAQVMQPGYVIAGRLLRPAMVGTAKPPQENQENDNNDNNKNT